MIEIGDKYGNRNTVFLEKKVTKQGVSNELCVIICKKWRKMKSVIWQQADCRA